MNSLKLKSVRVGRGENQKGPAGYLKISVPRYCLKENGKVPFTADEIKKLTIYYNLELNQVDEIFFDGNLTKGLTDEAV